MEHRRRKEEEGVCLSNPSLGVSVNGFRTQNFYYCSQP